MQFVNNIFIEEESQPDLVKKKSVKRYENIIAS